MWIFPSTLPGEGSCVYFHKPRQIRYHFRISSEAGGCPTAEGDKQGTKEKHNMAKHMDSAVRGQIQFWIESHKSVA